MSKKKKNTRSQPKKLYRVRNWSAYDAALVKRGSLTVWISEDAIASWSAEKEPGKRGRQQEYSDFAIETTLTLKEVYHLTNRGAEGFLRSLFEIMKITLPVPDHTTLSVRGKNLDIHLPKKQTSSLYIVVDSTGLKIYGEGEWKTRKHGISKRRTWRKLHLSVNTENGQIEAVALSEAGTADADAVEPMLAEIDQQIDDYGADGAYDKAKVYQKVRDHSPDADIHIPPRKDARIWQHGNCKAPPHPRDENLRYIRKHGRPAWKRDSTYHQRSLAETAIFRMKTIFGDKLSTRLLETQYTQARIRCRAFNIMTLLGMPESQLVA
jgi:DDE family transposase